MWKQRCKRSGERRRKRRPVRGWSRRARKRFIVLKRLDRKVIDLMRQAGMQECHATAGGNEDGSGGSTRGWSQMAQKIKRCMELW